jgi:LysR family hydrogen peroxide-inducible transcriptional activator
LCDQHHFQKAAAMTFSAACRTRIGGANMQMHQIRYFLSLCEECNFTRAAKRSGVTQPSLTNAIGALERELGGPLFHRRPLVALTALGAAIKPYLSRIAENADHAREAALALAPPDNTEMVAASELAGEPSCSSR